MTSLSDLPEDISEREFQKRVISAAKTLGWLVQHTRPSLNPSGKWSTAIAGNVGFPDLTLARKGVVWHWELKKKGGKLSPDQERWRDELRGTWRVFTPDMWDEILVLLARRD